MRMRAKKWARPELAAMVERGIISGSKGKLNPTGNVTRGAPSDRHGQRPNEDMG